MIKTKMNPHTKKEWKSPTERGNGRYINEIKRKVESNEKQSARYSLEWLEFIMYFLFTIFTLFSFHTQRNSYFFYVYKRMKKHTNKHVQPKMDSKNQALAVDVLGKAMGNSRRRWKTAAVLFWNQTKKTFVRWNACIIRRHLWTRKSSAHKKWWKKRKQKHNFRKRKKTHTNEFEYA